MKMNRREFLKYSIGLQVNEAKGGMNNYEK